MTQTTENIVPEPPVSYAYALGRLQIASQRLLDAIDHEPIRKAGLDYGLHEAAAMLKDALAACPRPLS